MCNLKNPHIFWRLGLVMIVTSSGGAVRSQEIFSGRVTNSANNGSKPVPEVLVKYTSTAVNLIETQTDANGNYELHLPAASAGPAFLLYHLIGYKTQIVRIDGGTKSYNAKLETSFFAPDHLDLSGNIVSRNAGIAKAKIYAHNGVLHAETDAGGKFRLPVSLTGEEEGYLWIEAENYETRIQRVENLKSNAKPTLPNLELTPSTLVRSFHFAVRRSDDPNLVLRDVEIRLNGKRFGKTSASGIFDTTSFTPRGKRGTIQARFSHPSFVTKVAEFSEQDTITGKIFLEPPEFKIAAQVSYLDENDVLHPISNVKFYHMKRELPVQRVNGRYQLRAKVPRGDVFEAVITAPSRVESLRLSLTNKFYPFHEDSSRIEWLVARAPLKVRIAIDSTYGSHSALPDSLVLVQEDLWLKAGAVDREGKFFELESKRLNYPRTREGLQVLVLSEKYETLPELIGDWQIDEEGRLLGLIRLRPKTSWLTSADAGENESGKGVLVITTKPEAAEISLEGVSNRKTLSPDTLENLLAGRYLIKAQKGGYINHYHFADIVAQDTTRLALDLGEPFTPLAKRSHLKIAAEAGLLGWSIDASGQNDAPVFPTGRLGGHLLYRLSPNWGVRVSYLASRMPSYYLDQVFAVGVFAGKKRWKGSFEERLSLFEASKEIIAKFDGFSHQLNLWHCFGREKISSESLPYLEQYPGAVLAGFESSSFRSINKTPKVTGAKPKEREISAGILLRAGRGLFDVHAGFLLDRVAITNEKAVQKNAKIRRFSVRYLYFLN